MYLDYFSKNFTVRLRFILVSFINPNFITLILLGDFAMVPTTFVLHFVYSQPRDIKTST